MAHFLGIDIGTSSVKAILMDESGSVVGSASRSYPASQPQPLWSEQDPDTWWHGTITALSELQQTHPDAYQDTVGIGLSGQMHGAVVLDAKENRCAQPSSGTTGGLLLSVLNLSCRFPA